MDLEQAWGEFQKSRSVKKASIAEKLDTIAAQLNEIQTDSKRTAELVPKILGDDAAINASNSDPMAMMGGGMPPMGGDPTMGGGMPPGMDGGMPPMGGDPTMGGAPDMGGMPPEMGGAPPMGDEGMAPPEDALGGTPDMGGDMGMGDEDMIGNEEEPMPDEGMGGDMDSLGMGDDLGGAPDMGGKPDLGMGDDLGLDEGVPGAEDMGMPTEDVGMEPDMGAEMGGNASVDALKNILHEKADQGDMEGVKALAEAIEALEGTGGSMEIPETGAAPGADLYGDDLGGLEGLDEGIVKSDPATGLGAPAVMDAQPVQQSADDTNEGTSEKVLDVLGDAVSEVMEILQGGSEPEEMEEEVAPIEDEGEPAVEVEIEAEPSEEESDDSEEEEDDLEKEHKEDAEPTGDVDALSGSGSEPFDACQKSATSLSFKDILNARMNGEDVLAEFMAKSAGSDKGYNETDPWMLTRRNQMFKKTNTIADDINEPMSHMKGSANGGDAFDEIGEEKGTSDHSVRGGEPLDDVDEEKSSSDHSVKGGEPLDEVGDGHKSNCGCGDKGDLLDDVDEEKSSSEGSQNGKTLLDGIKPVHKSIGREIPTLADMMGMKKSSRPGVGTSINGDLVRPELGKITKSVQSESVRMGRGVDPHKVVEQDWKEYNDYKAQKRF